MSGINEYEIEAYKEIIGDYELKAVLIRKYTYHNHIEREKRYVDLIDMTISKITKKRFWFNEKKVVFNRKISTKDFNINDSIRFLHKKLKEITG